MLLSFSFLCVVVFIFLFFIFAKLGGKKITLWTAKYHINGQKSLENNHSFRTILLVGGRNLFVLIIHLE